MTGETGQRVRAVAYDVVRIQAFPWPVPRPLKLRRDLLFQREAVVDLPPVGQRFAGRQGAGWQPVEPAGRQVVGVDGLEPVQGGEVLGRTLQLERAEQGDEVEHLRQIARGLMRGRERAHEPGADRLPVRELLIRQSLGESEGAALQLLRKGGVARKLRAQPGQILRGRGTRLVGRDAHGAAQLRDQGLIGVRGLGRDGAQRGQQVALRVDEDPHRALPALVRPPEHPVLVEVGFGVAGGQPPAGRGMTCREGTGADREQRALQGLDRLGETGGPLRGAAGQVDQQAAGGVSGGGDEQVAQTWEGFLFGSIHHRPQGLDDRFLLVDPRSQRRLPRPALGRRRAPLG